MTTLIFWCHPLQFLLAWWLVCFLKALSSFSVFSVYPAFSVGAGGSLFLFCNQLFINTTVNVFRLFQSGGCTVNYLIDPFCSTFWMPLMNGVVDIFCVESFFFLTFKMISWKWFCWCQRLRHACSERNGLLIFLWEVVHCSSFQHNLEPSIRTKKCVSDESPVWPLSFDRREKWEPRDGKWVPRSHSSFWDMQQSRKGYWYTILVPAPGKSL